MTRKRRETKGPLCERVSTDVFGSTTISSSLFVTHPIHERYVRRHQHLNRPSTDEARSSLPDPYYNGGGGGGFMPSSQGGGEDKPKVRLSLSLPISGPTTASPKQNLG
jgi:hypothetical protein